MKNIKSYRLSAQLKAELNFRQKRSGNFLKKIHLDWSKIPFKTMGIFVGVFVMVIGSYVGIKSLYEIQTKKNEIARQAKIQTYEQRLAQIKAEVALKGTDAESFAAISAQYLKDKDVERAEEAATIAVEKDPKWRDAYINQGHIFLVGNKFDKAKIAFEKAIEIDPLCGQAHYLLSLAQQELKDNDAAKIEFAKAKQFGFETEIGG